MSESAIAKVICIAVIAFLTFRAAMRCPQCGHRRHLQQCFGQYGPDLRLACRKCEESQREENQEHEYAGQENEVDNGGSPQTDTRQAQRDIGIY